MKLIHLESNTRQVELECLSEPKDLEIKIIVEANAIFDFYLFANLAQGQSSVNIDVELVGPEAAFNLIGAYDLREKAQSTWKINIRHLASHTHSNVFARGIGRDKAIGYFKASVNAAKNLQVIKAHQKNYNLLLSSQASLFSQPFLEINTDQIECSHGATVGQLDPNALFYLQSRGISLLEAKQMLTEGFLEDVILKLPNESWQKSVRVLMKGQDQAGGQSSCMVS